jgi:hypothetical protein
MQTVEFVEREHAYDVARYSPMYQIEQMLHFSKLSDPDDLDEAHLREQLLAQRRVSLTKPTVAAAPAKARESGRALLKELQDVERSELRRIAKASEKRSSVIDDLNALMLTSSTTGNARTRKPPLAKGLAKTSDVSRFADTPSPRAFARLSYPGPLRTVMRNSCEQDDCFKRRDELFSLEWFTT